MRVNNFEVPDPDTISWQSPEVITRTIADEPVVGATWRCSLGYEQVTTNAYRIWARLLGSRVEFTCPIPYSQSCQTTVTGYVESVEPRYVSGGQVISGADIVISGIYLDDWDFST